MGERKWGKRSHEQNDSRRSFVSGRAAEWTVARSARSAVRMGGEREFLICGVRRRPRTARRSSANTAMCRGWRRRPCRCSRSRGRNRAGPVSRLFGNEWLAGRLSSTTRCSKRKCSIAPCDALTGRRKTKQVRQVRGSRTWGAPTRGAKTRGELLSGRARRQ